MYCLSVYIVLNYIFCLSMFIMCNTTDVNKNHTIDSQYLPHCPLPLEQLHLSYLIISASFLHFVSATKVYHAIANSHHQSQWENPYSHPYFDNSTKRDVTITVGQTANLPCRVRNLGDRAVSQTTKQHKIII